MYKDHVPIISAAMKADLYTFKRGVLFAIASIQQPIESVPDALREIEEHGAGASVLQMPMKWKGYDYLQANGETLWRDLKCLNTRDGIVRLLGVPSLGVVKAAFVMQFLGHDIGCLDTRNLRREGIPMRTFSTNAKPRPKVSSAKINLYFKLAGGRAEELWNTWCKEVSADRLSRAAYGEMTPDEVSALHLAIVRN